MQTEEQRQLLGAFVRARREGLRPDDPGRRRRTPGLRREELADRAGISVTWLSWIEQGRTVRASAEALARLAGALRLTRVERAYLFELAGRHDPANPFAASSGDAPASIGALVAGLPYPAYGLDPAWTVCTWNAAARRLFVGLLDGRGSHRNLLRYVFTEDDARRLIPDWEARACRLLAEFRTDYSRNLADPRARAIVAWLREESGLFRRTWDAQAVAEREGGLRRFDHPEDGPLSFRQHTLLAAERPDFKLVALLPDPPP